MQDNSHTPDHIEQDNLVDFPIQTQPGSIDGLAEWHQRAEAEPTPQDFGYVTSLVLANRNKVSPGVIGPYTEIHHATMQNQHGQPTITQAETTSATEQRQWVDDLTGRKAA